MTYTFNPFKQSSIFTNASILWALDAIATPELTGRRWTEMEDIWGHRELCPSATGDLQFKGVRALLRFS